MSDAPEITPTDATVKAQDATGDAGPMQDTAVTITARPATGFWRAGRHHPPHAVFHPPGTFTDAEMMALLGEPQLVVAVGAPAAADSGPPTSRRR